MTLTDLASCLTAYRATADVSLRRGEWTVAVTDRTGRAVVVECEDLSTAISVALVETAREFHRDERAMS